jgi:hypothetical protein
MKRIMIVSVVAVLLAAAMPLLAHHSFAAEYDGSKPVTKTGVLKEVDWRNPHIYYRVDVKEDNGSTVTWTFEGYPPNMLVRRPEGWTRDKVLAKIGDRVTVSGWLARAGGNAAHSRQFTFSDGSKMESGPGAGNGGPAGPGGPGGTGGPPAN